MDDQGSTPFDYTVLGAGFAGSIAALALHSAGKRVALIDRAKHPRFAVGESSTPAAGMVLTSLADTYGLSMLKPLAKYGAWHDAALDLVCGLKRGFSYFDHGGPRSGESSPSLHENEGRWDGDDAQQLLVSANPDAARGDLHWRRADVDHHLFRHASKSIAWAADGVDVDLEPHGRRWRIQVADSDGQSGGGRVLWSEFILDATGGADVTGQAGRLTDAGRTRTAASFGHVRNLGSWDCRLSAAAKRRHPFPSDAAAQHHWLGDGWLWILRFDDGAASVGRVYAGATDLFGRPPAAEPVAANWPQLQRQLRSYPALSGMLSGASAGEEPWRHVSRLQRRAADVVGENWALLPSAAGVVDPLHSTGIAHSLCGLERLLEALTGDPRLRRGRLRAYAADIGRELDWIDTLIGACYGLRSDFRLVTAATMLYFAAATTFERRRLAGQRPLFLCADDDALRAAVESWLDEAADAARRTSEPKAGEMPARQAAKLEERLRHLLQPWNHVGLCDPSAGNMYRYEPEQPAAAEGPVKSIDGRSSR